MTRDDYDDPDEDGGDADAAELVDQAEVICPWCGEAMTIAVDPGGGSVQEYEEDCQVCCRPWRVSVHFDRDGIPSVEVERAS